jgi:hypothetical protein
MLTQLRALLISMGGRLELKSTSFFDRFIFENFNTNLNLTLISNPEIRQPHCDLPDKVQHPICKQLAIYIADETE